MFEPFLIRDEDSGLVIKLIHEANILLASMDKNSPDYEYKYYRLEDSISIMRAIEATEPQQSEDIQFILNTINTIWNKGILSPLTLEDDEFESYSNSNILHNLRYKHIVKFNGNIYNKNAYKVTVRNSYDHISKCKIENGIESVNFNPCIFISKGGVITGEYIQDCIIRKEVVNKHCFTIQSIINIPVSVIYISGYNHILVVDHREPKLKALQQFYDCPINVDDIIKNCKCNIRNYKK